MHIAKKIKSNGNIKDACRESGRPLQSQKHHQRRPVEAGRYKFEGYVKIEGEARLRCHGGTYGEGNERDAASRHNTNAYSCVCHAGQP